MKKQQILLFDNDTTTEATLNDIFLDHYEISTYSDINIAKEEILRNRVNLILIDVISSDGYSFAHILKSDASTSSIPLIFITDNTDKDNIDKYFQYGAIDYISKPFHSIKVESKIKNTLQLFHLRDSLSNALEQRQKDVMVKERHLKAMDEHILYIDLDQEYKIVSVSSALVKLFGCSKEEFFKKKKYCLTKDSLGEEKFQALFEEINDNQLHIVEIETKDMNDNKLSFIVKITKEFDCLANKHIGYVATFDDVTAKKLVEQKNRELDKVNKNLANNYSYLKQFKKAVEEACIFSITDENGIIKEVNKNFENISGYTEVELLGKPHNIVRHKDMPKEAFRNMWETIQSGKIWKGTVKNRCKSGKAYYVISEVVPICDSDGKLIEYISIRSDVTELEEYKQLLKNELDTKNKSLEENIHYIEQYEDAINNSIGILKTGLDHTIHYANDKFCQLSGYTNEELVGTSCVDLRDDIHKDVKECALIAGELQSNRAVSRVMTNIKKSGKKHYVDTVFYPVSDVNGNIVENLQVMYDITETVELNEEIINTQKEVVFTMGAIGETRSKETGFHVKRVAEYSYLFATLYGLSKEDSELLKQASPMHDIGKVAIADSILNKPARLTTEEFEIMKTHAEVGYEMLKYSNRPILKASAQVAMTHHERYDGNGYPKGLKSNEIPIFGRITALADVFDALGHDRCYKKAWELPDILEFFKNEKGKHFDPELVDIFFNNLEQFLEIKEKFE
ncbi:MAG: PAS domain S-box protein [Helicobacteraceae bacterium]|nr:PAS domain S-box protein [Helicobacteraceae bacterium]